MKIFVLVSAIPVLLAAASPSISVSHGIEARNTSTTLTCGDPKDAVPFYREWIPSWGDHFYSTSAAEIASGVQAKTATPEGETGYVFTTQVTGTVPLYRLFGKAWLDHLYIISPNGPPASDSVFALEGIACYVYPTQTCGSIPLYRLFSQAALDHFYTTSLGERNTMIAYGGYVDEGIEAYVLPAGATGIGCN